MGKLVAKQSTSDQFAGINTQYSSHEVKILPPYSAVLEKLRVAQLVKKFQHSMNPQVLYLAKKILSKTGFLNRFIIF